MSHLRFVLHIARGYSGYGLPIGDLVQEGNVGLMKAVKRFDPDMGVRLVSFAVHWIRAEIHDYVLRNWRLVKIATTKAQRKLFFNLRRMKKNLAWLSQEETQAVAKDLGVTVAEVTEMEKRLSARDLSFDPAPDADDEDSYGPSLYLPAPDADPALQAEDSEWDADVRERLLRRRRAPGCAQPGHPAAPLDGRRQGHAARAGRRIRHLRRTRPPDRGRGPEATQVADGGLMSRRVTHDCVDWRASRA